MAVENVTPERKFDLPLEAQLTGAGARMLDAGAPFSWAGAGYQLLPDQAMGQIYMAGPNATLFGNNPFGLTPQGQGYFGGAYNSMAPTPLGYGPYPQQRSAMQQQPQQQGAGRVTAPQTTVQGPSFGQGGFDYASWAAYQQRAQMPQQYMQDPYNMGNYFNNPFPGYTQQSFIPSYNSGGGGGYTGAPAQQLPPRQQQGPQQPIYPYSPQIPQGKNPNLPLGNVNYMYAPYRSSNQVYGVGPGTVAWNLAPTNPFAPKDGGRANSTQGWIPPNSLYAYKYAGHNLQSQPQQTTATATVGGRGFT